MIPMVGETIRRTREGLGLSIRELGRRAGVSAAQLSRIEAGQVAQPSIDTLVAVARALDRNPKPLLIASGHIGREEALATLRPMFRENRSGVYDPEFDSELVDEWAHGWEKRLEEARALLAQVEPNEQALRELAADVFFTYETEETMWWESFLAPLLAQHGGEELREHVRLFLALPHERRAKVNDYLREQVRLADLDSDRGLLTTTEAD
jgi:transcriptional regulator with XRE-family HTH domain